MLAVHSYDEASNILDFVGRTSINIEYNFQSKSVILLETVSLLQFLICQPLHTAKGTIVPLSITLIGHKHLRIASNEKKNALHSVYKKIKHV